MRKFPNNNIYNKVDFFYSYIKYRDEDNYLNDKLEQPSMRKRIAIKSDSKILDIGCGFGNFCKFCIDKGALKVIGIDSSLLMINEAIKRNSNSKISYSRIDIINAEFEDNEFDLITSSLVFHYIENINPVFGKIHNWLKPKGKFIFTINHPDFTSNLGLDSNNKDYYKYEGPRPHKWLNGNVIKYHKTMETYLKILKSIGFKIISMKSISPINEIQRQRNTVPQFLLFELAK